MASDISTTRGNCTHHVYEVEEWEVGELVHNSATTFIAAVVMPIVLCLGVLTNAGFLFAVLRTPRRVSHTTLYLAHTALADLLYLAASAPVKIGMKFSSPLVDTEPFGTPAQCVIFFSLVHVGYYSSIALVTAVSYERFLSLCHPLRLCRIRSRRRTHARIALCWLVGLALACACVPVVAGVDTFHCLLWPDRDAYREFPSRVTYRYCRSVESVAGSEYIFSLVTDILPWFSALAANAYMYARIVWVLRKFRRSDCGASHGQEAARTGHRVTKMVVVNGVVYFVCQTPYNCLSFYYFFCRLINVPSAYSLTQYFLAAVLLHVNSAVNPLIYSAMNPPYRAALMEACRRNGRGQDPAVSAPLSTSAATNRNAYNPPQNTDTRV